MSAAPPALAVVVSAIGRSEEFTRLIESVDASSVAASVEFVVVDQSADQQCAHVARSREWIMSVQVATSGRGASLGRNTGLAPTRAPEIVFPDDDAWYTGDTLRTIIDAFAADPQLATLCGRSWDARAWADGRPDKIHPAPGR